MAAPLRNVVIQQRFQSTGTGGLSCLRPQLFHLGVNEVRLAYDYLPHMHPHYEIIVVQSGCYRCTLNGTALEAKAGEIVIVKPGDIHADCLRAPLHYVGIGFRLDPGKTGESQSLFEKGIEPRRQALRPARGLFDGILGSLLRESSGNSRVVAQMQEALFLEFFWTLVGSLPGEMLSPQFQADTAQNAFLFRLNALFERNKHRPFRLADLARELDLSVSTLSRRCREVLGVPPAQAFAWHRMDEALRLLRCTDLPVKEIGFRLGFRNQFHFSRLFKKRHGLPPSRARG